MILDVEPVAKPRMTRRDRWKERPCVLRYWDFADQLRAAAIKQGYTISVPLSLRFGIPMPSSWRIPKRIKMAGTKHEQKPDLDNLIKGFKDILSDKKTGDQHIWAYGRMEKVWCETGYIEVLDD